MLACRYRRQRTGKKKVPGTIDRDSKNIGSHSAPKCKGSQRMKTMFTYWKETDGRYLGYLNSHPDHWTQGDNFDDLKEHLRDLYEMFSAEDIPGIKRVEELDVA